MNPLDAVEVRLNALIALRELLNREIGGLQDAQKILKPLYEMREVASIPSIEEFVEASEIGITDSVRAALRNNAGRKLTAMQVRDVMVVGGFDLSKEKYKNPMATIHQVIRRLVDSGQVRSYPQGNDRVFQWAEKPTQPATVSGIFGNSAWEAAQGAIRALPDVDLSGIIGNVDFSALDALAKLTTPIVTRNANEEKEKKK